MLYLRHNTLIRKSMFVESKRQRSAHGSAIPIPPCEELSFIDEKPKVELIYTFLVHESFLILFILFPFSLPICAYLFLFFLQVHIRER